MSARILVIEDNATNLDLMTYLLEASGYAVIAATTAEEGIQLATAMGPDLVLCDIQLPDRDGLEVAAILRRDDRLRPKPLVAVTAMAMVGDRERILAGGFDGYISKPIEPEQFLALLAHFLRPPAGWAEGASREAQRNRHDHHAGG